MIFELVESALCKQSQMCVWGNGSQCDHQWFKASSKYFSPFFKKHEITYMFVVFTHFRIFTALLD